MPAPRVILVVDDDESVRLLLSKLLERYTYTVLLANDGLHALEVSRNHAGDIGALVTDYNMPGLDGLRLAQTLVVERPGLQVMIMSARMSEPDLLRQARFPLLPKPFTITGFMASLKRCLDSSPVEAN